MKTKELYTSLEKALDKVKESLDFPNTEPMRESTIQRFEYTFELSWKLMNSILKDQSIDAYGVRNVIREAARLGLVNDPKKWFEFALARNKASHIYKEKVAIEVHKVATTNFVDYVEKLLNKASSFDM